MQPYSERVWLLPYSIRQKCALILGGNARNPDSIPIRKGYLTQSQVTVQITDILKTLGRNYREVPAGKEIHYRKALLGGYEYLFEEIDGAWTFDSVSDILLDGYTDEKTTPDNGVIYSIGTLRKIENKRSDGGARYLIKYRDEKKKYADIYDVLEFERDPQAAGKKCELSDELAQMIF